VKDVSEAIEDSVNSSGRNFRQFLSDLLQERDGHLHRVVRWTFKQQRQDLQGQNFVRNLEKDNWNEIWFNTSFLTIPCFLV
jgi:hypothetical protein